MFSGKTAPVLLVYQHRCGVLVMEKRSETRGRTDGRSRRRRRRMKIRVRLEEP